MNQIIEKIFNKNLAGKEFIYDFEIERQGLYGIEITASAKSRRQNFISLRSFLRDDDLAVKIDDISFPKKSGKKGLFDSEAAWNGSKLKGLNKTNFFLIKLSPGKHQLNFLIEQSPKLKSISIYQIQGNKISYLPQDNEPSSESNRAPWLSIILCNLGLQSLKIKAAAKEGKKFLFFKKNQEPKSHKNWYWCGKILKGESKTFEKEFSPKPDIRYIELWTDRDPEVEEIKIGIGESENKESKEIKEPETIYPVFTINDIKTYAYKGIKGDENYNRFDRDILEAVNHWNEFFFLQKYPPEEPLHPNLIKAMIYVESRMGYFETEKDYYPSYPDVMQVADSRNPAVHTLNNDGWIDPNTEQVAREHEWTEQKIEVLDYKNKVNGDTAAASIWWGARWLYHKAQVITKNGERNWLPWKEAVKNYRYRGDVKYQKKVFEIEQKGISPKGLKLWSFILIPFIVGILVFSFWLYFNQDKVYLSFKDLSPKGDYQIIVKILDGIWFKKVNLATVSWNAGNFLAIDKNKPIEIIYQDLDGDDQEELIISGTYYTDETRKYILSKKDGKWGIVYNQSLYGGRRPAFCADAVIFESGKINGKLDVVEQVIIPYSNALWQIWRDYYVFDSGEYKFVKRVKENLEN